MILQSTVNTEINNVVEPINQIFRGIVYDTTDARDT